MDRLVMLERHNIERLKRDCSNLDGYIFVFCGNGMCCYQCATKVTVNTCRNNLVLNYLDRIPCKVVYYLERAWESTIKLRMSIDYRLTVG